MNPTNILLAGIFAAMAIIVALLWEQRQERHHAYALFKEAGKAMSDGLKDAFKDIPKAPTLDARTVKAIPPDLTKLHCVGEVPHRTCEWK